MSISFEFKPEFARAAQLHAAGRLAEAEALYRQLAVEGDQREDALRALVELCMQSRRAQEATVALTQLTELVPDRLYYHARLAALLEGLGQLDAAIGQYRRLLERQPGLADAHYNVALLYRKAGRHAEALASYEAAVRYGIARVEEVYSNMGVLFSDLRRPDRAAEMYEQALKVNPDYLPALFNFGGLLEGTGERDRAIDCYRRIVALVPDHWEALARLAHARKQTHADLPLVSSLRRALGEAEGDESALEGLQFALGKALDDLGEYQQAFAAYQAANTLGQIRNPPYAPRATEREFDALAALFSAGWLERAATRLTARPIFICGMFRSGSTLVEQMLAAHPAVTAGGELDYLPRLAERALAPYPAAAADASVEILQQIGEAYLAGVHALFPDADHVTDKRPDNFLRLGLIRAVFPRARIIYTERDALDNCLSIYFHQLGGNLNYATDLENIAHYYRQHRRLLQHWMSCFGSNIFTVNYDTLVRSPEPILRRLLAFLGLEWDERCLDFRRADNLVQTGSVAQVREELYRTASGRWKNYAPWLTGLRAALDAGRTDWRAPGP
jgi:tetratricopeptide (TPR) repeat protein